MGYRIKGKQYIKSSKNCNCSSCDQIIKIGESILLDKKNNKMYCTKNKCDIKNK